MGTGHRARLVWDYVERQDLKGLYAVIKSREGGAAIAPEILFALWLYATLESVGSARELERLTQEHDVYRWICSGVRVNYRTLSDFRVEHGAVLDDLLTDNLAALMAVGVVKLKRVAQGGVRVGASAGAASFRREGKLKEHLEEARAQVQPLKRQIAADDAANSAVPASVVAWRDESRVGRLAFRRPPTDNAMTQRAGLSRTAPSATDRARRPRPCSMKMGRRA